MSDGDNATPGLPSPPGTPDAGGDNQWLTRSPRPSPGAAPWERNGISESGDIEKVRLTGNHTDGVTVADLIAKVHGDSSVPEELRRSRPEPEPQAPPQAPPTEVIPAVWQPVAAVRNDPDTEIIPAASMRSAELPDLARLRRADRVQPSRVGTGTRTDGPEPRKRRKTMVAGRAAAALIAVSALALTGGAWQWQSSKNNMLNKVSALDLNSRDILDPNAQFGDENFLIVGVDSRFGENSDMGAGDTQDAGGTRSDTVMLVNIPANRKRVVAVSFPRDLAITPMQCEPWNPETHEYGPLYDDETESYGPDEVYTETKLNSAYAFGGPKCLVKVIQKLSGLSVNRFMAVDFAGFAKMVDALGGVEVCSTTPLEDYELGTVLANAGRQTVDGHTALAVCARPAGDHRNQRRLRPHQAPAAVPVVAASLDDLQGSVLLAVQAQQRGQHVHRRQLRRQHQDQGPRRPRPVHSGRERGPDHIRHRADGWLRRRVRQRDAPHRGHADTVRRDHQRRPAARGEERRTTRRFPARPSRRRARHRTPTRPPRPRLRPHPHRGMPSWWTRSPPIRRTSLCASRTRLARTAWRLPRPANCSRTAST